MTSGSVSILDAALLEYFLFESKAVASNAGDTSRTDWLQSEVVLSDCSVGQATDIDDEDIDLNSTSNVAFLVSTI